MAGGKVDGAPPSPFELGDAPSLKRCLEYVMRTEFNESGALSRDIATSETLLRLQPSLRPLRLPDITKKVVIMRVASTAPTAATPLSASPPLPTASPPSLRPLAAAAAAL